MFRRAAAVVAVLVAVVATGAAPAAARPSRGDFTVEDTLSCSTADRDGAWRVVVTATTDTQRRAASVEYSLFGPDGRRGAIRMPIGVGRISVLQLSLEWPDSEPVVATRPGFTGLPRHDCQYVYASPVTGRARIVYVVPPRRPTRAEVEAYCAEFAAERPDGDWEAEACVPAIMAQVEPPTS